ncbi:MAG: lytic murein transglycosylase [Pseudomonadota bacterium]|nr:lytic murein transglycosylase [Pseudomonadota bacterium]
MPLIFIFSVSSILLVSWFSIAVSNQSSVPCGGSFDKFLFNLSQKGEKNGLPLNALTKSLKNTYYSKSVLELDRSQSAFNLSFADFTKQFVTEYRIVTGKKKMKEHSFLFDNVNKKFGVPKEVITAFWALETDFGKVQGNFHVLSSLATLAFDCRRSEFFQKEYFSAVELVEKRIIDAQGAMGAWAGEFGQIQMLPSDILAFSLDGDGDGKIDLSNSPYDTIYTASRMLSELGWVANQPWLEEVILPEDFQWEEAGFGRSRPLKKWQLLGVKPRQGYFSGNTEHTEATLLLPQGWKGPKFIVYKNFGIFLEWNNSLLYALTAAYLANLLKNQPVYISENPEPILEKHQIMELQIFLKELGADVGKVDGILGAKTRQAVRRLQISLQLPADSWPTAKLLSILGL